MMRTFCPFPGVRIENLRTRTFRPEPVGLDMSQEETEPVTGDPEPLCPDTRFGNKKFVSTLDDCQNKFSNILPLV